MNVSYNPCNPFCVIKSSNLIQFNIPNINMVLKIEAKKTRKTLHFNASSPGNIVFQKGSGTSGKSWSRSWERRKTETVSQSTLAIIHSHPQSYLSLDTLSRLGLENKEQEALGQHDLIG